MSGTELQMVSSALGSLVTRTGAESEYKEFKRPVFLQRIQFYAKGHSFGDNGFVAPGHYGVPQSADKIVDLGSKIDVVPLAMRMKGMDLNDLESIVVTCDETSDEYKRIKAAAMAGEKNYLFGPSYLVWERDSAQMYELFCGSKTLQEPANELQGHCPLTTADCVARGLAADAAHDPIPATLGSRKVESKKYKSSWFVSTVSGCSQPFFNLPEVQVIVAEMQKFLSPKAGAQSVPDGEAPSRAR
jgi:hypothetical protein